RRLLRRPVSEAVAGRRAGTGMSDFREEEALGKAYDAQLMRRVGGELPPFKWGGGFAGGVSLGVPPPGGGWPFPFCGRGDKYIVPGTNGAMPAGAAIRGIGWISLGYLAALLLSFAVQYLQVRIMQNVGQQTLYDLRKEIFERLQRLPMSFFDRSPVGRLVT